VIHIRDRRLLPLIVSGAKKQHQFPASYRHDGSISHPKMTPGQIHKIYIKAPFGSGGDPSAKPLAEVEIVDLVASVLGDMTEEDANFEGFRTLTAYVRWFDRIYYKKGIRFGKDLLHPVWIVYFDFVRLLPAGEALLATMQKG
jgi:hypothetical protein